MSRRFYEYGSPFMFTDPLTPEEEQRLRLYDAMRAQMTVEMHSQL